MKRALLALIVVSFLLPPTEADAFWWLRRRRTRSVSVTVSRTHISGTPAQVCQQKANIQARRGGRCFHPGGSFAGCRYEGVGSGMTPQQALNNCCYTGRRREAARAVAQGANGRWYAAKLFY